MMVLAREIKVGDVIGDLLVTGVEHGPLDKQVRVRFGEGATSHYREDDRVLIYRKARLAIYKRYRATFADGHVIERKRSRMKYDTAWSFVATKDGKQERPTGFAQSQRYAVSAVRSAAASYRVTGWDTSPAEYVTPESEIVK